MRKIPEATAYDSAGEAQAETEKAYAGVTGKWQKYRELTQDELVEIEEIRRDIQATCAVRSAILHGV